MRKYRTFIKQNHKGVFSMTKSDLARKLKEELNLRSIDEGSKTIDAFSKLLCEAMKAGDEVSLGGFGKFVVCKKAARQCRNPRTGESFEVPERKGVKFKPASNLKSIVNE